MTKKPVEILGVSISALSLEDAARQVLAWAKDRSSVQCVTFANAHMLAVASRDETFRRALNDMDMNCPDGRPLQWVAQHLEHRPDVCNVPGPDFLPFFVEHTRGQGLRHYFLGAAPGVAEQAVENLRRIDPDLQVVGLCSPKFAPLSEMDLEGQAAAINASEADVVWLSLGCPKQEWWMHHNRHRLEGKVVLAVGQAFILIAGYQRRAPKFARAAGLEWLYRLARDPIRLCTRYVKYNSVFLAETFRQHVMRSRRTTVR